jgi:nucleoid-associated protein YgaU
MRFLAKKLLLMTVLLACMISGCSRSLPLWREDAAMVFDRARIHGADKLLPEEFKSVEDTLIRGEILFLQDESKEADAYFRLAWSKGNLLESNLAAEKLRLAEATRQKAEAEKRDRDDRDRQKALIEEQQGAMREKAEAEVVPETRKKAEKPRQNKERLQVYHTVKRGETLPQIAARSDVYNDHTLWPLIYRANRDQIRDPRLIWPGQVLRIPRNIGRDDIAEARRYNQEKPLR